MTRAQRRRSEAARRAYMVRRILVAYDRARPEHRRDGEAWYDTARLTCHAIASAHPGRSGIGHYYTPTAIAGILAALSPRVTWAANVAGAFRIAEAGARAWPMPRALAGTRTNVRKAWRIACGESPADVLGGPKVRAFYANLTGDDAAVTVDVWAARAAEGHENPNAPSGRRYRLIADAYRQAARARGVTPRVMQATVWCAVRGSSGISSAAYLQPSLGLEME